MDRSCAATILSEVEQALSFGASSVGRCLLQRSPAVFKVYFLIDAIGKQKYLLHCLDGFIESLDGVELIATRVRRLHLPMYGVVKRSNQRVRGLLNLPRSGLVQRCS
jgi:hypothetical protein